MAQTKNLTNSRYQAGGKLLHSKPTPGSPGWFYILVERDTKHDRYVTAQYLPGHTSWVGGAYFESLVAARSEYRCLGNADWSNPLTESTKSRNA